MIFKSLKIAILALIASMVAYTAIAADSIKVGFNAPRTGFAAADGNSALIGAELAVEQLNAAGGVLGRPLELVVYDDQASPKESVPIATRLTSLDHVVAGVSGSYSGATRAAAAVFQAAGTPYIAAYAVHPDITRSGDFVFRTSFVGVVQGRAGAKLVGEVLGHKRVVIVTLQNDFGKSLTAGFKEAAAKYGIEIVGEYEYSIKDRQFGPIVSSIKADAPDAIYASGYFFTAGPLVSQLRAGGVGATVIGQEGYDSQKFIEIAGDAAEGVIITTSLDRDSSNEVTQSFIKAFEAKAGFKADMVAASGHTAILVLASAIEKAGSTDANAIRDALYDVSVDAATGTISFNSLGEVMKDVQIQIVNGGEWHRHSVISDSEVTAPPSE